MLTFSTLTITNFLNVRGTQTLPLMTPGLSLVVGKNGSGKSARYSEALTWCLFGETIRPKLGVNDVIHKDCDSAYISLVVHDSDEKADYHIRREKTRTSAQALLVTRDGSPVFASANLREAQERLVTWLGLDYRTFTNSIVFGQGLGTFFASGDMSDADRKAIFDRIYGLDEYDMALKAVAPEALKAGKAMEDSDRAFRSALNEAETQRMNLAGNQVAEAAWQSGRVQRRVGLVSRADDAMKRLEEAKAALAVQKKLVEDLVAQERQHRKALETEDYRNAVAEIALSEKSLTDLKDYFTELLAKHSVAIGSINHYEGKLSELSGSVKICPTCGQEIRGAAAEKHLADEREKASEKLGEWTKEKASLETTLAQAKEDFTLLKNELDRQQEAIRLRRAELEKVSARLAEVLSTHLVAEQRRKDAENAYSDTLDTLNEFDKETNPYTAILLKNRQDIEAADRCREEARVAHIAASKNFLVCEFWQEAFGPKGIKAFLIEATLPELNRLANEHLFVLTGGGFAIEVQATTALKKGTTAERMSVKVVNERGAEVYEGNSGGEKRRIDLAILLALQDLVSVRAQRAISLSVYDEVLDQLDDDSLARAVDYLRVRAKDRPTFLLSHNNAARALVEHVVEVRV
jgi:DNA repair exonuclease SbcCD ATPase subunit